MRIAVIGFALLAAGCSRKTADVSIGETHGAATSTRDEIVLDSASPKLASIGVETVATSHERVVAMLPAQLALDEDHTVRVFSPVLGRIQSLGAQPGAGVARGAPLARIASGDMAQATSDLVKAEALATQTAAALARAEDLYAHKVIAMKDLEQARADAAQARAERDRARQRSGQLGEPDAAQGDFVLRSPIDGIVIDRAANNGAEVRPDATSPLFTISALDTLWLIAAASQRDLASLHAGAHLAFTTDATPGRTFDARVTYVGDQLDPVTRTAVVRAAVPNGDRALRAMVTGTARLLAAGPSRLTVPTRALVTRGANVVVFVEKGRGRFEARAVTVEDDDGTTATIRDGLAPGDRVVTRGTVLLAAESERLP